MTRLIYLLSESVSELPFDVLKTKPLADADETAIFENPKNSKTLIAISSDALYQAKQANDPDLSKFMDNDILSVIPKYEVFQRNPQIYPKVINITPTYVELERLDTNKVKQDYKKLEPYLKNSKLSFSYLINNFYKLILKLPEMGWSKDVIELARKYANLVAETKSLLSPGDFYNMNRVDDDGNIVRDLDVHEDNFGYGMNGKLKILDF